jgi:hypothetical protein
MDLPSTAPVKRVIPLSYGGAKASPALVEADEELTRLFGDLRPEALHEFLPQLDLFAENPELLFVWKRDIRRAGAAAEFVDLLEPSAQYLEWLTAMRARVAESHVG